MRWRLLCLAVAIGCPAPGLYSIELPGEQCPRATRLAYRSMTELGYRVTAVVEATPAKQGRVEGVKMGADRREQRATVRIKCEATGVRMQPVEGALIPSDYDFSRSFGYSVKTLAAQPDAETPIEARGLQVLIQHIDGPRARLDLGGPVLAAQATLVRVTVRNDTDRDVLVDGERVLLTTAAGEFGEALEGAALAASLGTGKAARTVRGQILERVTVPAGKTIVRYLVFPAAPWLDGQVSIEDVETGESDGFVVPVQ